MKSLTRRLASVAGVFAICALTMGSASTAHIQSGALVAHTASLKPVPATPAPTVQPVILEQRVVVAAAPSAPPVTQRPAAAISSGIGGLTGSLGYARAGGNCVNEPGVNKQNGNPSSWTATSRTPWIGATFLMHTNHTGVVTGIWSNGDIEVRHQNWSGGQHRFPPSMFRGYR